MRAFKNLITISAFICMAVADTLVWEDDFSTLDFTKW
jgi:hypothetical protein